MRVQNLPPYSKISSDMGGLTVCSAKPETKENRGVLTA